MLSSWNIHQYFQTLKQCWSTEIFMAEIIYFKELQIRSSCYGWLRTRHSVCEDLGLIPGLTWWFKDLTLQAAVWLGLGIAMTVGIGLSCSSSSTPSPGTSICCRCGPKKKKNHRLEFTVRPLNSIFHKYLYQTQFVIFWVIILNDVEIQIYVKSKEVILYLKTLFLFPDEPYFCFLTWVF